MKALLKSLKRSKKLLGEFAKAMPDLDAYATSYCIVADLIDAINDTTKDLAPSLKEAKVAAKKDKTNPPNRAKKWCKIK